MGLGRILRGGWCGIKSLVPPNIFGIETRVIENKRLKGHLPRRNFSAGKHLTPADTLLASSYCSARGIEEFL